MTDMYDTFDDKCFPYYTTSTFDFRTKKYLISRYKPTATWDYGDVVTITFNLHDCDLTPDQVEAIEGKTILIKFYNFRFEELDYSAAIPATEEFQVIIDYNTSMELFKKGTYRCSLQLVSYNDNDEIDDCDTILSANDCCFYVQ